MRDNIYYTEGDCEASEEFWKNPANPSVDVKRKLKIKDLRDGKHTLAQ